MSGWQETRDAIKVCFMARGLTRQNIIRIVYRRAGPDGPERSALGRTAAGGCVSATEAEEAPVVLGCVSPALR